MGERKEVRDETRMIRWAKLWGEGPGIISHVKGLIFNKIKDLILNNVMALRGLKYFLGN